MWKDCGGSWLTGRRAAADVLYEVLTMMVKMGPLSIGERHEL